MRISESVMANWINTLQRIQDSNVVKKAASVYAPLDTVKEEMKEELAVQMAKEPCVEVKVKQIRSTVIHLGKCNQEMLSLMIDKYGWIDVKRRLSEEDFDDEEIMNLWNQFTREDGLYD